MYPLAALLFKISTFGMITLMAIISLSAITTSLYSLFLLCTTGASSLAAFLAGSGSPLDSALKIYLLLEGCFVLSLELKYRYDLAFTGSAQSVNEERLNDFLKEINQPHFNKKEFIKGWFLEGEHLRDEDLSKCDVEELITGMFFNKRSPYDLDEEELKLMEKVLDTAQRVGGFNWPRRNSYQKPLKKIALSLDHHTLIPRPLLFYVPVWMVSFACYGYLQYLGFQRSTLIDGLDCFHRPPELKPANATNDKPAIVFLHGLGIGLPVYAKFAYLVSQRFPENDIVFFEVAAISMKLSSAYIQPDQFAHLVKKKLGEIGIGDYITVSHSMGTAMQRWLDFYPSNGQKLNNVGRIFIDPICFQLWNPDIAKNAVYRTPSNSHEIILSLVAMKEIGIGVFLGRHFTWFLNCYFTHEVLDLFKVHGEANTKLYVSELDDLVHIPNLCNYFTNHLGREKSCVKVMKGMRHGACFFTNVNSEIIQDLANMMD